MEALAEDEGTQFFMMNEFMKMKVRDTLFRNEKIMAELRKTNPVALIIKMP